MHAADRPIINLLGVIGIMHLPRLTTSRSSSCYLNHGIMLPPACSLGYVQ